MLIILYLILAFGIIAGIELPGLIRKKRWKDLYVFSGILVTGLSLAIIFEVFHIDFAFFTDWMISTIGLDL